MKFQFLRAFLPCVLLIVAIVCPSRATTIDPLTLEQLTEGASFVGIVECETAGGIVAKYRVVESWKGVPVGTRFSIKTPFNFWESQFPISLVGERSVITAYAEQPPSRIMSDTSGGGVPLWWRAIPYEYSLPLFQGQANVPTKPVKSYYAFGEEHTSFAQFKARVQKFLALSLEASETALMRSVVNKYSSWSSDSKKDDAQVKVLKARIAAAQSIPEMITALFALKRQQPDFMLASTLKSGGAATLQFLETSGEKWPIAPEEQGQILNAIKENIAAQKRRNETFKRSPNAAQKAQIEPIAAPDAKTLAALRRLLTGNATTEDSEFGYFDSALATLSKHDPATVTRFLVSWENKGKHWSDSNRGYVMGSYFAWQCGANRAVHLRALSRARDPFIRVAGAVYLCFEDKKAGMKALRLLQNLPGDPGVWAALNLVRRGEKSALPRALKVFATSGSSSMEGVPHRNLQKRLLVLLSNSAKKSNLPQPMAGFQAPSYKDGDYEAAYARKLSAHLQNWWKWHGQKVRINDPWLPILEQQKID